MIMTADVRPEHRAALPAITHVNGSARVQTINKKDNPEFHALVQAVGKVTGREMVLNTSFTLAVLLLELLQFLTPGRPTFRSSTFLVVARLRPPPTP